MMSKDADWIEWSGGECPVLGKRVQYRMHDGHEDLGPVGTRDGHLADDLIWGHGDDFIDIIAYRVVQA